MKLLWEMGRKHSAILQAIATRFGIVAVNAATGLITARALQPMGRGELAAMIVWPGFLSSLAVAGLPSSLVYNLKRDPESRRDTVGAALVLGTILGILSGLLGAVIAPWWLSQYPGSLVHAAQLFMVFAPVSALLLIGRAAFEANGDFSSSNIVIWMTPFPTLIILGLLAAFHRLTALSAARSYLLGGMPIFIWMLVRLFRMYRPSPSAGRRSIGVLVRYAIRSYGFDLATNLVLVIDQVFVVRLLPPAVAGVYVVTVNLARALSIFSASTAMILFPRTAARPREEVMVETAKWLRLTMIAATVSYAALALVGPFLLSYVYGPAYVAGAGVLRLLALEVLISGGIQVLAQAFLASGYPTIIAGIQTAGMALSVVLMLALVPVFGLMGVGIALLIATGMRLICTLLALSRIMKVHPFALCFPATQWLKRQPAPALVEE